MRLPSILKWVLIAVAIWFAVGIFTAPQQKPEPTMTYSELVKALEDSPSTVTGITVLNGTNELMVDRKDQPAAKVVLPGKAGEQQVLEAAQKAHVPVSAKDTDSGSFWGGVISLLFNILPFLFLFWLLSRSAGGGGMLGRFQQTGATRYEPTRERKTFNDVAGCNEAKQELQEVVEYLKDPTTFVEMGAKLPRGVLLIGGPGNGKTLLAKAVAGEAGVPFFALSASEFVEMLVGVGAARARDLFKKARANMPCIIFIDEIDAVGRHRGTGIGGGHDEREQTLNEILVQMDGFTENEAIVIMAATNRPDILDPAVTRAGRFDRHVMVDSPDMKGRADIFAIHSRPLKLASDVNLGVLAGMTPGFSGADIAAACNEAATVARRRRQAEIARMKAGGVVDTAVLNAVPKLINMADFSEGIDRVMMGPARPRIMTEDDRRNTAVHEVGHAGVGHELKGDPVRKVTIMPRARALGFTLSLPEGDRFNKTREELINEIASMMGGRVAQEVILGVTDTGAANDFKQATAVARRMVTEFGMSELGHVSISDEGGSPFLGRVMSGGQSQGDWGSAVKDRIDAEVLKILEEATKRARQVVETRKDSFERVVQALLQKETILGDEFVSLWEGR